MKIYYVFIAMVLVGLAGREKTEQSYIPTIATAVGATEVMGDEFAVDAPVVSVLVEGCRNGVCRIGRRASSVAGRVVRNTRRRRGVFGRGIRIRIRGK
jgi:hypothetical protein